MKTIEWTEDLKLSDGRTIVVQRANEYRRVVDVGAGFERGWNWEKASISAQLPWPIGRAVSWEGSLFPLVLDMDSSKTLYFVGLAVSSKGKHEWKLPPRGESYVAFRWKHDGWERIPLDELPQSTAKPNLLVSSYQLFFTRAATSGIHVDTKLKEELDADPTISRGYKEIIRSSPQAPTKSH